MHILLPVFLFMILHRWVLAGPIVNISQGILEGDQGYDIDGNKIYKFLGIPYAKPPVGNLRFKNPQPAENWEGILNATKEGKSCSQETGGFEDCLYLNVYTRELTNKSSALKPVMVWIHGGGFVEGSSREVYCGAEFLLTQDIVLVTLNYRLGLLGFLRFKDSSLNVTGNMGFKDQVQALKWVQKNIYAFNGNPNNVTIFGQSAGSASVHYLVLSPLAQGLFNKAILQSGAALNGWADDHDIHPVAIAQLANSNISTEKEALNLFEDLSISEIITLQAALKLTSSSEFDLGAIGLVIEEPSSTAFISKRPIDIIRSGEYNQVPLILGYTNREGILFNEQWKTLNISVKAESFIPEKVDFFGNKTTKQYFIDQIQKVYLSGPNSDDNVISAMTDSYFIAGIIGTTQNHALTSKHPVHLYKMSLDTRLNFIKVVYNINIPGCSHADDLGYLFNNLVTPIIQPGSVEDVSMRRLVKLWTNFAKFGNPTPDENDVGMLWLPANLEKLNTLHIDEKYSLEVYPEYQRMLLWRDLFQQSYATSQYLYT